MRRRIYGTRSGLCSGGLFRGAFGTNAFYYLDRRPHTSPVFLLFSCFSDDGHSQLCDRLSLVDRFLFGARPGCGA